MKCQSKNGLHSGEEVSNGVCVRHCETRELLFTAPAREVLAMAVSNHGQWLAVAHQQGSSIQFYIYALGDNGTLGILHFEMLKTMDVAVEWNEPDSHDPYPPLALTLTLAGRQRELTPRSDGKVY